MAEIGFVGRSYRDYSGEVSSFELATVALTSVNFTAQGTKVAALDAAIANLTNGELAKTSLGNRELVSNDAGPFGSYRENKLLVTYRGNTSEKLFRTEIPCPALVEANTQANSDLLKLDETEVAALVTAFEDLARSPDNGTEAVTVMSIRFVGRNI